MTRDADKPVTSTQPKVGQPGPANSAIAAVSSRSVIINGQSLRDQDIQTIERTFRVQVKDGDYWYDRMNGSWGVRGGPTAGFIMAGLNMGGPLPEDASNGIRGVRYEWHCRPQAVRSQGFMFFAVAHGVGLAVVA